MGILKTLSVSVHSIVIVEMHKKTVFLPRNLMLCFVLLLCPVSYMLCLPGVDFLPTINN